MKISLVVTTYNRPDALRRVIASALDQELSWHEILIADDGSGEETRLLIEEISRTAKIPIIHIWHEDKGFRAAAIRNRAIERSSSEYLVFVDGDCLLPKKFSYRHALLAEAGRFVAGNRILLSQRFTSQFLNQHITFPFTWVELIKLRILGDLNRLLPSFTFGLDSAWRYRKMNDWEGAKTCNLAIWKSDLIKVNGFDELFSGWGMEDSDLVVRLLRAGVTRKDGRFATGVFHLWHKENDRSKLIGNKELLRERIQSTVIQAENGLKM